MRMVAWALLLALTASYAHAQEHRSPYAGEQERDIKAVSSEDIQSLLEGRGMGLARAAELNRYPGPLHVLELADALRLTPAQRAKTEDTRTAMLMEAKALGRLIVETEKELDRPFASGDAEERRMRSLVGEIARLQGELRAAHLRAHLETRRLLTLEQVEQYIELRGYNKGHPQHRGHENATSR